MRQCPACGANYDVLDTLCPACGREVPAPYEGWTESPRTTGDPLDADSLTAAMRAGDVTDSEAIIFSGAEVMLGDSSFETGTVVITRGRITEVLSFPLEEPNAGAYFDVSDFILAPGLVNLAPAVPAAVVSRPEEFLGMAALAAAQGVTALVPRLQADSAEALAAALEAFRAAQAKQAPGARLLGVRIDSPFSNPAVSRHPCLALDDPRAQAMLPLFEAYSEIIRLVTLAPELPGAYELILRLRELKINVSLGRSAADYDDTMEAVEAGATHVAGLFEAMPPLLPAAPGLAGAALERDELFTEFRCDAGVIHPALQSIIISAKGAERALPVTAGGNPLDAVRALVDGVGWDLTETLAMVSATPAALLGVPLGAIQLGAPADLVLLDQDLQPVATLVNGRTVWQRQ